MIRLPSLPDSAVILQDALRDDTAYALVQHENTMHSLDSWSREVLDDVMIDSDSHVRLSYSDPLSDSPQQGTRILMTKFAKERYDAGNIPRRIWRAVEIEWELNGWVMAAVGNVEGAQFPFRDFAEQCPPPSRGSSIVEAVLDTTEQLPDPPPLVDRWMKILGQPLVPINLETRKAQLATAYQALAPYIAAVAEEYHPKKK